MNKAPNGTNPAITPLQDAVKVEPYKKRAGRMLRQSRSILPALFL